MFRLDNGRFLLLLALVGILCEHPEAWAEEAKPATARPAAQTLADADGAAAAAARETADDDLALYMDRLARLQSRWQQAAQLFHDGNAGAAKALLGESPYDDVPEAWLPEAWRFRHQGIVAELRNRGVRGIRAALWYADTEAAALAVEAFTKDIQSGARLSGSREPRRYSQCLVELGRYSEARAVLEETLRSEELSSYWRAFFEGRLKALATLQAGGTPTLAFYQAYYLNGRSSLSALLDVWQTPAEGPEAKEKGQLLAALFRKMQDRHGERLVLLWTAAQAGDDPSAAAEALVGAANMDYEAKRVNKALAGWRAVETQYPNTSAWGKAVFNIGLALKDQGRYREAIAQFSKMFTGQMDDREPGGHIMEAYRNYRPRSQWEIGNCLFAQKKYREALEAYRLAETKYPFRSWCGTCQAGYRYRYAFYQGLCYDWLGEPATAVRLYCKAIRGPLGPPSAPEAYLRIVDLYEAAGQREALGQLLDAIDRQHLAEVKRHMKSEKQIDDQKILKSSSSRTMRRVLELRQMEAAEDWDALIALLKIKGTVAGPDNARARRGNWEAVEAARLLAKHSKVTVPPLIARLERADRQDVKWLYYALGRCGTAEAVEALKANALKETNSNWTNAVIYALSLAGEKGDVALRELAKVAEENLKGSIQRYREGQIGDRDADIIFPEPKNPPSLPKTPDVEQRPS